MPIPSLSDDEIKRYLDALERNNGSVVNTAAELGCSRNAVNNARKKAAKRGLAGPFPYRVPQGYEIKRHSVRFGQDGNLIGGSIETRVEPLGAHRVPKGHTVKGESALVDAEGRLLQRWVKTTAGRPADEMADALREALSSFEGLAPCPAMPEYGNEETMSAYVLTDTHIGMMSWGRETGQPYDLKIATSTLKDALDELIARAHPSRDALIIWNGDTTHQNDQKNMTPRSGHILDVDGRFPKVLRAAADVALHITQRALERHQRVTVRFVEGNHDPEVSAALTLALGMFYAGNERVRVDDTPGAIFYYRFGRVLIGATHGHTMPPERAAMAMAVDRREDWGDTTHHHIIMGHLHREGMKEVAGVRVETFQSPAARDAYAQSGGWRSGRSVNCITYHRDRGEVGRIRVNL